MNNHGKSARVNLTHVNEKGDVHMVSVGEKETTKRTARATATIRCSKEALRAIKTARKGDVLATVRIAAIQAAKRTPELIPLCHSVALTHVTVDISIEKEGVRIDCAAHASDRTGVEMEALTAASIGALTFYDMLKAIDKSMRIQIELSEKSGGRSGHFRRPNPNASRHLQEGASDPRRRPEGSSARNAHVRSVRKR